MNTVAEICAVLRGAQEFTIFMHHRPDGDTVGSAAALGRALKQMGKTVQFLCSDPITPKYAHLVGSEEHTGKPRGTLIAVDIAAPDMGGRYAEYVQKADIVIDHHGSNPGYGKLNLIRPEAAAAGEVVYDIVRELVDIDREIAEALYTAISTDTGCFRHGSTTAQTHRVAAELMDIGLDITALNRRLFTIRTRASLMIQSALLKTLQTNEAGSLAVLTLTRQTIADCGADEDDMENIASLGMQIQGVRAAATLREMEDGVYKTSVRSDGTINAATVCRKFGGGGHAMAAGCTLDGTAEQCRDRIMAAMSEEM